MRGSGTVFTRRVARTPGRVWRADSGDIKSRTRSVGQMSCLMHQHSNSLINLSSNLPINSFTVSALLPLLTSNFTPTGSGSILGSADRPVGHPPIFFLLGLPLLATLLGPLVVGSSVTVIIA